jgi:hypothetical protein
MIRTIAVVVAAVAALSTQSAAQAAPKKTDLQLSYMAEAGYAAAVKLGCDPATGVHPQAGPACDLLRQVDGVPGRIKAADTMCMMIYAPITAEITGTWRGRRISWKQTYGNKCMLNRATGVLFTF